MRPKISVIMPAYKAAATIAAALRSIRDQTVRVIGRKDFARLRAARR